jgi:predicted permease
VIGRPQDRVRNFSLLALAYSTSGFLGPILAGFAIDGIGHAGAMLALAAALGMLPVFWAMGATLLVAGAIALRRSDRRP